MNKDIIGPGMSIRARIKNCYFYDNSFVSTEDSKVFGQGAIYSDQYTLVFSGTNKIYKSGPTAIVLDSSSLSFSPRSITSFVQNFGVIGGALCMYGLSWLMFGLHSEILFQSNRVQYQGGAIYVKPGIPPRLSFKTTLLSTKQCFFRYEYDMEPDRWPINVTFDNNYSVQRSSGNSIYALTIQYCRTNGTSRISKNALQWKPFKFQNNPNNQSEIVTSAVELDMTEGSLNPYPNLPYSPDVTILDEKNQHVYATVKLGIALPNYNRSYHVFHMKDKIPSLRVLGNVGSNFSYQFRSVNGLLFESNLLHGTMQQCPPGYRSNAKGNSCICMDAENGDVLKCFEENSTVLVLNKKWGYLDNDKLLKLIPCPLHFCKCNGKVDVYKCKLDLLDQCINNRNGTLCGECNKGYSVILGNEDCELCANTNLFIMLFVILVGVPLFIVCLLLLNCDAISGHLDAYLFSNQMFSVIIKESIKLDPISRFIIGTTSFTGTGGQFGICLYNVMDNISKLGLNYVLPISIIMFTLIIAKAAPAKLWVFTLGCRRPYDSNTNQERKKRNFGRALSFVAVLCYSSITNTSFRIIHYIEIKDHYYVYNAPGTIYFSYPHNILLVVACLLLLLISVGFPLLLCFEEKLSRINRMYRIFVYFSPIATALKSYFKYQFRVFAIFYFLLRFIILLFDMILHDDIQKLIAFTTCFMISLLVFSAFQPYRLFAHNILDMIIITVVAILSLLSIIINVPFALKDVARENVCTICKVLVWLPLVATISRFFITLKNGNSTQNGNLNNRKGLVPYMPVRGEDNIVDNNDVN